MNTKSIIQSTLLVAGFSAVTLIGSAQAQVVNVDFLQNGGPTPNYSGQGAYSDAGNNFWNPMYVTSGDTNDTLSSLKASNGTTTTGISVNVSSPVSTIAVFDSAGNPAPFAPNLLNTELYHPDTTVTISGLTAGDTYSLYIYAQNGGYDSSNSTWTFNSVSGTTADTFGGGDTTGFVNGGNYTVLNVTADGSGDITGGWSENPSNPGIDGLQIVNTTPVVEVPEPSTMALLGLGALGLAFLIRPSSHGLSRLSRLQSARL